MVTKHSSLGIGCPSKSTRPLQRFLSRTARPFSSATRLGDVHLMMLTAAGLVLVSASMMDTDVKMEPQQHVLEPAIRMLVLLVLVGLLVSIMLGDQVVLRPELLAQTVFLIVLLPMVAAAGAQGLVVMDHLPLMVDQVVVGAMRVQEQAPEMAQQVKEITAVMDITQVLVLLAAVVGVLVQ